MDIRCADFSYIPYIEIKIPGWVQTPSPELLQVYWRARCVNCHTLPTILGKDRWVPWYLPEDIHSTSFAIQNILNVCFLFTIIGNDFYQLTAFSAKISVSVLFPLYVQRKKWFHLFSVKRKTKCIFIRSLRFQRYFFYTFQTVQFRVMSIVDMAWYCYT